MKLLTLALSAMLFALAAAPSANAWVRPEWVVVRWANADCKIWHNDTRGDLPFHQVLDTSARQPAAASGF
jgi:hypothetical protein